MPNVKSLKNSIHSILKYNKDGSFETQKNRAKILHHIAYDLFSGGFKLTTLHNIKQKHIVFLVKQWQAEGLAVATIKNRMSIIRWACRKVNRLSVVPSNKALEIGTRIYVTNQNKAIKITESQLEQITNSYVYYSLRLQMAFGFRREEAIKFKPFVADQGDHIVLQSSWCKGGRERVVPILTQSQRDLLDDIKEFVEEKNYSLIPPDKKYITQRHCYNKQLQRAGIQHAHGLRHAYAHRRYKELTGFECRANGGLKKSEMTPEQQAKDLEARHIIALELGHNRISVVNQYCGR